MTPAPAAADLNIKSAAVKMNKIKMKTGRPSGVLFFC